MVVWPSPISYPHLHGVPTGNGIPVPANGEGTEGKLYKTEHRWVNTCSDQRGPTSSSNPRQQTECSMRRQPESGDPTARPLRASVPSSETAPQRPCVPRGISSRTPTARLVTVRVIAIDREGGSGLSPRVSVDRAPDATSSTQNEHQTEETEGKLYKTETPAVKHRPDRANIAPPDGTPAEDGTPGDEQKASTLAHPHTQSLHLKLSHSGRRAPGH
ncbi:unnamed protein product [Macrosiphum euphorbiae]|uniref:Uncharacterized protein n=1 Tax=Macrosiphum euphorbiae TaxID=13131 RepID=A0AAV0W207_9HEMI|nr:unnamed protein product [Macrosiphum euphorbiae]